MQLFPAARGTEPHRRHLGLWSTPVLRVTRLVMSNPCAGCLVSSLPQWLDPVPAHRSKGFLSGKLPASGTAQTLAWHRALGQGSRPLTL